MRKVYPALLLCVLMTVFSACTENSPHDDTIPVYPSESLPETALHIAQTVIPEETDSVPETQPVSEPLPETEIFTQTLPETTAETETAPETIPETEAETETAEEELLAAANRWELRHGGISGRTAQQFINFLEGKESQENGNP